MLPHHAMALEMSVPALLGSNNPQILNPENIIISQAKEMRQFKGVDSRTSQEVVSYTNIYFENEFSPFPSNKKTTRKRQSNTTYFDLSIKTLAYRSAKEKDRCTSRLFSR